MPEIILHGASSFLGKHFARRLYSNNIPFIIVARNKSDLSVWENLQGIKLLRYNNSIGEINLNIESSSTFYEFSWQGVFGVDRNDPSQITTNIPLIISSIEFANRIGSKHWIGIGSQAEYGNLDKKISESDFCNPTTLYGKSKLISGNISKELCKSFNMQHSWLRLFSVYGPDDNHEWLIQYLIKKMLKNEPIDVTKAEQIWDYLFVEDISDLLLKLSNSGGVGIANLGSGNGIVVKEIINIIKDKTGSNSIINFGAIPYRPDQVMKMEADIKKLREHTGWSPNTDFETGIQKTINSLMVKN